jgi:hypothetical protein
MDTEQLYQLTIDLPPLEKYFHPSEPSRKPLYVVKNDAVKGDLKLTKFGEPVEFVPLEELEEDEKPYFEFSSVEIGDDVATVGFRYPVEGIRGKVNFKYDGEWKVLSHEIVETS